MVFLGAVVLVGVALNFVFKASRVAREDGHSTIATMLTVSSIGFAITLLIVLAPMLAWVSNS